MKHVPKGKIRNTFLYILLTLYSIVCIYPLIWMIFYSFKNNTEIFVTNPFGIPTVFRVENYIRVWNKFNVLQYFSNSAVVTVATVIFTILLALMFAYATARMEWKLSSAARIYITSGMFIPVQIILIPLVILARNLHFSNSLLSLIIPYTAFQLSFASLVFYAFFRSIPFEIEESATIDGANVYTVFFRIMIPLVKPAVATVLIFIFLFAWNEFMMALILISDNALRTLPLGLVNFQGQFQTDWGAMGAMMTIISMPTLVVYLFFSEHVEKALTVGSAVKG